MRVKGKKNLGGEKSDDSDEESEAEDGPQEPTEDMSDEQKIQLLKRQAPLLFPLIEEFKIYNTELKNTLEPLSKLLRDAGKKNRTSPKILLIYRGGWL